MSTAGPSDLFGDTSPDRSEALIEALVENFHDRLRRGENPDLYSYQQAYPHLAVPLEQRLLAVERLHELAASRTGPFPAEEPSPEPLPSSLGRYELRRVLGRGATAVVYEAFDTGLRRPVALKVLRADLADSANIATRFTRDARLAARLRHSHIVPMHEAGVADGRPYIDMELVDGVSLEEHLQNRPGQSWDARAAAQLVWKTALALAHAHQQGILHRDVKPSNILIDSLGEPQLTDFGLARELAGATALTAHGDILGTPAYMSPEQASGQAHRADARSDVYSLGVIFYRLLTGRLPFWHVTAFELLACTARSDVPPIRGINSAVPRDLETICLKALEREADDRFRTAQEFADELWRWLHDEPVRSSRPSLWGRVRRWRRRNRAMAAVLTGAALLLACLGGGLGWALWWQVQQTETARLDQAETRGRWKEAWEHGEREASLRAELQIRHLLAKARQRLHKPTKGRRLETQTILRQIKEPRGRLVPGKVRDDLDLEARSLFAATLGVPEVEIVAKAKLPNNSLRAGQVVIHPDGNSVVLATRAGPIRWVVGETLRLPENTDLRAPLPHLAYSPGGKFLVFAPADGSLQIWDESVTRKLADLAPPQPGPVLGMGSDRAGKTLWTCRTNGRVEAWSLPDSKAIKGSAWNLPAMSVLSAIAFDHEATRLAVGDSEGRVVLIGTDGMQPHPLQGASTEINALAWSPDGRRVAAGCHGGDVHLWDLATGHAAVIPASDGQIHTLAFHPEGQWLTVGCFGVGATVFDAVTRQPVLQDVDHNYDFSADGRRFVGVRSDSLIVVTFRPPVGIRRLAGDPFRLNRLAWSRDNRHLISLDSRFTIRVWDRERPEAVAVFRERPTKYFATNAAVALSDDGRLLSYASGGESRARGSIREVATGKVCSSWELGGGYGRLACTGGNNFVLVREEIEENKATTRTVAYELSPGRSIGSPRVLRRSEPGDVRRFFVNGLSADGRYYWWTGPRLTPWNRRVEVYDVHANRPLLRLRQPTQDKLAEITSLLSPDGRYLWYGHNWEQMCSLAQPESSVAVSLHPLALSPDEQWSVRLQSQTESPFYDCLLLGRGWHSEKGWLALSEHSGANQVPDDVHFSPDSRYLAWGDEQGTLHIADLPFLEEQVRAFAEDILAD